MTCVAEEYLRESNLRLALSELTAQVKSEPDKVAHRVFLFQLLSILGDWERALTQLNLTGELDAKCLPMVQTYREALRCEVQRSKVFSGQIKPLVFGEPEEWIALMLEALKLSVNQQYVQALQLRSQAFDAAPPSSGTIDGESFEWIADADTRIGPFLEAVINGSYYWIPFHYIKSISFDAPEDLRDLVWTPAQFTWANGGEAVGLIPTRYPNSAEHEDDLIKMAKKTDWIDLAEDYYIGQGQRMFVTDVADISLLNIRHIEINQNS